MNQQTLMLALFMVLSVVLIAELTDVSAQKALPQNIYCLMTVQDTMACHETEEACEIGEDLQQSIINSQSFDVSFAPDCKSYSSNIASTVPSEIDEDNDNDNENEEDENQQPNTAGPDLSGGFDSDLCASGCVNEGTAPHSGGIEPEGDVDQTFDNDQSSSGGDGHVAQDESNEESNEED